MHGKELYSFDKVSERLGGESRRLASEVVGGSRTMVEGERQWEGRNVEE